MTERRIKELSIALEALSRINCPEASDAFNRVEGLLKEALSQAENDNAKRNEPTNNFDYAE